ncbi:MAG: DUF1249 domain-containing protein [Candidatus Contendobacter sp.]|nr:DUF1249 domain-containing protein [Candidatus Contendobacter sp.]MDS4057299.1 DUF1249 domain-containing protein [Candidatus Contendobacter sp.]
MILLCPSHYRGGPLSPDSPGTFAALMELYERNYINIRRLLPVMPPARVKCVSRASGALDLHLCVTERCRYTSELILTYQFDQDDGSTIAEPNLWIRVYHDARQAEVMAAQPRHCPTFAIDVLAHHRPERIHRSARWRINRFLYKWLGYCLHQGHRFATGPDHWAQELLSTTPSKPTPS